MKQLLLFAAILSSYIGYAQNQVNIPLSIQQQKQNKPLYNYGGDETVINLLREPNPFTAASNVSDDPNETIIGETDYDLQSNSSVQNRIVRHSDGSISAVWTFGASGDSPNFPGRGTGYNYYDGNSWGATPTERLESKRTGWPSIAYSSGAGELVMSHMFMENSLQLKRANKGTGQWNEVERSDVPPTSWPRTVIGGTDGMSVHMIAITLPVANQGALYQGQDGALLYSRSTDGGATWAIQNQMFADLDSSNYTGFSADAYAMAEPHGNTLAFVMGNNFSDVLLMKSTDNGDTWTKTVIQQFPYQFFEEGSTLVLDTPMSCDGSLAIILDDNDVAHVFWGAMRVLNEDTTDNQTSYFPGTNGLMYWNESFGSNPPVEIAGALDIDGNQMLDILTDIALYYASLSSLPSAALGDDGALYVSYSAIMENLSNGTQNYRHIYMIKSTDGGMNWSEPVDVTPFKEFAECVFASLAPTVDDYAHLVYQRDFEPGLATRGDEDAYDVNEIVYLKVPKALNVGIMEATPKSDISLYPNPSNGNFTIQFDGLASANVEMFDLLGNLVWSEKINNITNMEVNANELSAGTYLVRIATEEEIYTRKLVIK